MFNLNIEEKEQHDKEIEYIKLSLLIMRCLQVKQIQSV